MKKHILTRIPSKYITIYLLLSLPHLLFGQQDDVNQRIITTSSFDFECEGNCYNLVGGDFHFNVALKHDDGLPYELFDLNTAVGNPVVYVSGNTIHAAVIFQSICVDAPTKVIVRGVDSGGNEYFPETPITVSSDGEVIYPITPAVSSLESNKVDLFELAITWQIHDGNDWVDVALTSNRVYVVKNAPVAENPSDPGEEPHPLMGTGYEHLETMFYLGCQFASGATTSQEIVDGVWNGFSSADVKRVDGQSLHYYQSWECSVATSSDLIRFLDGQCYAWAALFIDVLKTQGIQDDFYLTQIESSYLLASNTYPSFLVKNWNFTDTPLLPNTNIADFPYLNILHPDFADVVLNNQEYLFMHEDVSDDTGVSGQNVVNPASGFLNHVLAKVYDKYYDPSYGGVAYDNTYLYSYEQDNIVGYYYDQVLELPEDVFQIDFDENGYIEPVSVLVSTWTLRQDSEDYSEMHVTQNYNY